MTKNVLIVIVLAVAVTACAAGGRDSAPGGTGPARPSTGPPSTPSAGGAGESANTAARCPATADREIHAGAVPDPVCLPVGGSLRLTAEPSPRQPWGPLVSSDDTVLSCTSQQAGDGARTGSCTALRPGTVAVTTVTVKPPGGPPGPQQFQWRLTVTVRP